jgi:hypothetical protein
MKKFKGYYIVGSANREEALLEKGLMLWSQTRPNLIRRVFNRILLGIYWIDKERVLEKKQDAGRYSMDQVSTMPRYKPVKDKKSDGNAK